MDFHSRPTYSRCLLQRCGCYEVRLGDDHDDGNVTLPDVSVDGLTHAIDHSEWSLWRYRSVLPLDCSSSAWRSISLGEGCTPLVDVDLEPARLKLKVEYAMPTLSFKDRGAVTMLTRAKQLGAEHVAADSSGNAGTAVAAYAARLGMRCEIFVPASTSAAKIAQIEMHGAVVHRIDGPRQAATEAAKDYVGKHGIFYASHVLDPYFHEGTKTFAYEIWEQLGFTAPDHIVLPVGHGTLVLGTCKGFRELHNGGYIPRMPRIHAVQASACAPIAEAFSRGDQDVRTISGAATIAEGIAITHPTRGAQILEALRLTKGEVMVVSDEQIDAAREDLAAMGFYVEPTAAAAFAALCNPLRDLVRPGETWVVPLCGAGLKSPRK